MAYYYSPFRNNYGKKKTPSGCPFCDKQAMLDQSIKYPDGTIAENKSYRWIVNIFPKFEGHTMVVPKKHITHLGTETIREIRDRDELISLAAETLTKLYKDAGIEIFIQTGTSSESSVQHLHWHVVPSQKNDPLRGFDKLGHFFTIEKDKPRIIVFPVPIQKARQTLLRALSKTLGRKAGNNESGSNGGRKRK